MTELVACPVKTMIMSSPSEHVYTSKFTRGDETKIICSYCGKAKPEEEIESDEKETE